MPARLKITPVAWVVVVMLIPVAAALETDSPEVVVERAITAPGEKFVPLTPIVTEPEALLPKRGVVLEIEGAWVTRENAEFPEVPMELVTVTLPLADPVALTTIEVLAQLTTFAVEVPLVKLTVEVVVPKFEPAIVTDVLSAPKEGERDVIAGGTASVTSQWFWWKLPLGEAPPLLAMP